MTAPYEIEGRRGALSLYFEGDELAIDLTEYRTNTLTGLSPSVEMFLTYQQIGELIEGLRNMQQHIGERKIRRTREAALQLEKAGVSPRDPAEVTPEELRHNPDIQESVALFYLNEVNNVRTPDYPF